jgi:hypothetical protein
LQEDCEPDEIEMKATTGRSMAYLFVSSSKEPNTDSCK